MHIFLCLILFCCQQVKSATQFPDYTFRYYDIKDGLKDNEIYNICEDRAGFIWIGSSNGLHRFDGISFKVFESGIGGFKGLAKGGYRYILKHSDGSLWIASDYDGASRYDAYKNTFTHFPHNEKNSASIGDVAAYKIVEDQKHNVWFAHYFKGISKYDYSSGKFIRYRHIPGNSQSLASNNIYALCKDQNNKLWIGYQHHGLSEFDPLTNQFKHYTKESGCGLETNNVYGICFDNAGTLWLSTSEGPYYMVKSTGQFKKYTHPLLKELLFFNLYYNAAKNLVYATSPSGLHVINPDNKELKIYLLHPESNERMTLNRCTNLTFDKNNQLWIQFNEGFCLATEKHNKIEAAENITGLDFAHRVNHFEVLHKTIIWNISNGALVGDDVNTHQKKIFQHQKFNNLKHEDAVIKLPNQLSDWLAIQIKGEAILLFNTVNGRFKELPPIDSRLRVMGRQVDGMIDSKGNYWTIDAYLGIVKYMASSNSWMAINPGKVEVNNDFFYYPTKFHEDIKGNVWCLNPFFQLVKYSVHNHTAVVMGHDGKNPYSPANQIYFALFEDKAGNIWLAGNGNTLDFYNSSTNAFYHYIRTGCFEEKIYGITMDKHYNLWLFGQQSIARMTPPRKVMPDKGMISDFMYSSFNWKNGIYGHYFGNNYVFAIGDVLYFDSKEGLRKLDAGAWDINRLPPAVYINEITVNGQLLQHDSVSQSNYLYAGIPENATFNSTENNLVFSFSAINYIYAENNRFCYRLKNYDKRWAYCNAQSPVATFHNLPPGSYQLEVMAANNDGIWNKVPARFSFTIRQPFLQSIWFKILIAVLVLSLIIVFYRIKISELLRLQNVRNKISRDLHDNIGATISSASFSAKLLDDKLNDNDAGKYLTNKLRSDIHELGESIDDIVWSVNPNNDSWEQLFSRMRRYSSGILEDAGIAYTIDFPEPETVHSTLKTDVRKELFLVFKEAVNNAVKHSKANMVNIQIKFGNKTFEMTIADNGIGFDKEQKTHRNGLKNMITRIQNIKGDMAITSEPGKGTVIKITI
ncbi:MAG: two-component regulator propeller domain-containing protein [Bacteroidota bacterium]